MFNQNRVKTGLSVHVYLLHAIAIVFNNIKNILSQWFSKLYVHYKLEENDCTCRVRRWLSPTMHRPISLVLSPSLSTTVLCEQHAVQNTVRSIFSTYTPSLKRNTFQVLQLHFPTRVAHIEIRFQYFPVFSDIFSHTLF